LINYNTMANKRNPRYNKVIDGDGEVFNSYRDYVFNSQYWQRVRRNVLLRDNFVCTSCKKVSMVAQVHHKRYVVNGRSIVGRELAHLQHLETMCKQCHKEHHKAERKRKK